MQNDDQKLVTAFRAGDNAAFDALYGQHAGRVFAFAQSLTGSRADAEDLTQETFVAAFRGRERFRGQSRLLTWLLGIALRRWRDRQRNPPPSPFACVPPGQDDGMAERVVAGIAYAQALDGLDEPLREAFLLVAVQGLTHREAAELVRRPVGTVKWRVAEAVRRLRTALTETKQKETTHVSTQTR